MQRFVCLLSALFLLTACGDVTPEVHSRVSIQLPSTDMEDSRVWAVQGDDEVEAERISDNQYQLDLSPELETQLFATIFQIALEDLPRDSSESGDAGATRLIEKWIAWNGQTEMFFPPAGSSSQTIELSKEALVIGFEPVMKNEADEEFPWVGAWPGLLVEDTLLNHSLSYPLAQSVSVPPNRSITVTPLHPLGEILDAYTANTDEWQVDSQIDLGLAPPPFPITKMITVDAGTLLSEIGWRGIYEESEVDRAYLFECHLSTTSGDVPDCNAETIWIPCGSLVQDTDGWNSQSVEIRYADLPSVGCGRVVVTRQPLEQGPCETIECEDGLICVGDGDCVAQPQIKISMVWDQAEGDSQYLLVGDDNFNQQVRFRIESDSLEIMTHATPQLLALEPSSDGSLAGSPIPGSTCAWDTVESGRQLYATCSLSGGSTETFENSMAALSVQYRLAQNEAAVFPAHQKFRVLGLPETTDQPVILQALPAYGSISQESQFVQLWVQLGYHASMAVQTEGVSVRLEAAIREVSSETSIVDLDPSLELSPNWNIPAGAVGSEWFLVQMNRDEFTELFPDLGFLTITLEQLDSDGVWNEGDEVSGSFEFVGSTPTFVSTEVGLRLPADEWVLGESPVLEFPMRGLGPNRGGYVVHIGTQVGDGLSSEDPALDPLLPLGLSVSEGHQFYVMSRTRRDLGLAGTSTSAQSLVEVESVQPTQPVSLAFNRLFVTNASNNTSEYQVRFQDIGVVKNLLWDPEEQELVVVGQHGIEFVRTDTTDPTLESNGVVELNEENVAILPPAGTPCSGEIVDAVVSFRLDAADAWRSDIVALVLPGDAVSMVQHCVYSPETETFSQLSLSNVAEMANNSCAASLYSKNLAFAHNPLNNTYWVLSDQCLLGYQTQDSQDTFGTSLIASLPTGTSSELGFPVPSDLAIEPHSGVAVAQYFLHGRTSYKRFVLGSDPSTSPSSGQRVTTRTAMAYDTVRGWTWEVAGINNGSNGAAWYWMPSVGDLAADSGISNFVDGGGITHAVMDASRDVIYSLKLEHRPEDGFVVTQEINDIADDASNILLRDSGTQLYRSQDAPVDVDGDALTDYDEIVLGTSGTDANRAWDYLTIPYANQPVIGIVLMGPQVIGGLPSEISAGDILTIQGNGFTGNISRDQACVQGTCVAPISSTPTAITFRVPDIFSELDYPLRAFVTVSDGHRMSGPVPGDSKLVPVGPTWRTHIPMNHEFSCGGSAGDCEGGGFIHGASDTYLQMYDVSSTLTAYRLESDSGQPTEIYASDFQAHMGPSSTSPYGSGITLGLGQSNTNQEVFYEMRGTTQMNSMPDLPAQTIFGATLDQSRAFSSSRPLRSNSQVLDDYYENDQVMITADLSKVGLGNRLDADGQSLGWAGFSRHMSQAQEAPQSVPQSNDSQSLVLLAGLGRYVTAATSGPIDINIQDDAGTVTNNFSASSLCDWGDTEAFYLLGATSRRTLLGVGVLDFSPLRLGIIKLNKLTADSDWESHCTTRTVPSEGSQNIGSFYSATPGNGAYLALGFERNGIFEIYVWETHGSELKLIFSSGVNFTVLGLEFSPVANELYILGHNNVATMRFEKTPVEY